MTARKGSIYFLVLAATVILVASTLAFSYRLLTFRHDARQSADADQARVRAELGLRHALWYTTVEPLWRQVLHSDTWVSKLDFDNAVYSVTGIDPIDDDLSDSTSDPVLLTATATVDGISRSVRVRAMNAPLPPLAFAVASGNDVIIAHHARVTGDVTANDDVSKSGGDTWIFGDAQAVDTISDQTNISGTVTTGIAPLSFPDSSAIFNYYWARATQIPFTYVIERKLLSPTSNPWGSANPNGLYAINCMGQRIVIKDSRIVGTLILLNPRSDSRVESAINWTPARADYPALLVGGSMQIAPDRSLSESSLYTDFSLPSEPGRGSWWDTYPNRISGLVYATGDITLDLQANLNGALLCHGYAELKDCAQVLYDSALQDTPPRQFSASHLRPTPRSWQEIIP